MWLPWDPGSSFTKPSAPFPYRSLDMTMARKDPNSGSSFGSLGPLPQRSFHTCHLLAELLAHDSCVPNQLAIAFHGQRWLVRQLFPHVNMVQGVLLSEQGLNDGLPVLGRWETYYLWLFTGVFWLLLFGMTLWHVIHILVVAGSYLWVLEFRIFIITHDNIECCAVTLADSFLVWKEKLFFWMHM